MVNPDEADFDGDRRGDLCDADDDNDGLTDAREAEVGSDTRDRDTDGDLHGDATEVSGGSSPTSPCSVPGLPVSPACPVNQLPVLDDQEPVR